MKLRTINPTTGKFLEEFDLATEEEVSKIISKARFASNLWRETDIAQRTAHLAKVSALLKDNKNKLARTITLEMGKPIKESIAEIEKCAWTTSYFAENAKEMLKDETAKTESLKSYVKFEPLGIIFAIMPWNYPFWQVIRCVAPALCAGNAIILKHSSYVPKCSLELERVFKDAGLPEHVFRTIIADSRLAEKIIESDIDAVSFTGSVKTGSRIAELSGKNLKKFVLELGGSDPFIVLADADIEFTSKWAVASRMIDTGQSCIAAKRFIVVKDIADEFEESFTRGMEELRLGDPLDPETQVGPLVREEQRILMEELVKDAVAKGAKILTGGQRAGDKGFYFKPTVITNVSQSMRILNEETFGPIAPIIRVNNDEEAIREANNVFFGLGSSIWSKDRERAERLAQRIQAGSVYINKMMASDPRLPFGGIKKSGIGRELSKYGILEFTNIKTILVN